VPRVLIYDHTASGISREAIHASLVEGRDVWWQVRAAGCVLGGFVESAALVCVDHAHTGHTSGLAGWQWISEFELKLHASTHGPPVLPAGCDPRPAHRVRCGVGGR
jgi:hypothetical protein